MFAVNIPCIGANGVDDPKWLNLTHEGLSSYTFDLKYKSTTLGFKLCVLILYCQSFILFHCVVNENILFAKYGLTF